MAESKKQKWPEEWVARGMVNVVIPSAKDETIYGCHNGIVYNVPVNRQVEMPKIIYKDIMSARAVMKQSEVEMKEFETGEKKVN